MVPGRPSIRSAPRGWIGVVIALLLAVGGTLGVTLLARPDPLAAARPTDPLLLPFPKLLRQPAVVEPRPQPVLAPQQGGLEITKIGPDRVSIFDTLTYTLIFTNHTGQTLQGVIITDTWTTNAERYPGSDPPLAEYDGNYTVSGVTVDFFTYTVNQTRRRGEATWRLADVGPGVVGTLVFTMGVPDTLQPGYRDPTVGPSGMENSAVITTSTPGVAGDEAIIVSSIVGPVLKLSKSVETETGASSGVVKAERIGRLLTYTIRIDNLSTDERADSWPATQLRVWEDLPSQFDYVTAWAAEAGVSTEYVTAAHRITWTFPTDFVLNPGQTTYVTFTVRVRLDAPINQYVINRRADCQAIAAEMVSPVQCISDLSVKILNPMDKTFETTSPPSDPNRSFPNRPITYTIYVYNPLQEAVNDLRVVDELPATFWFEQMVDGPAPTSVASNVVTWEGLALPASGVISFTFRAYIGAQTPVGNDCGVKGYYNVLTTTSASFPDTYVDDKLAQVTVVPQIRISKRVVPSSQYPGGEITYTITLQNDGDTPVQGIIITDAMPSFFRFVSMVSSPPPGVPSVHPTDTNVIWWDDVPTVPAGGSIEFSFRALADGDLLGEYGNDVYGYSPGTYICDIRNKARVKIVSPLVYEKVGPADPVVQGETFPYTYTVWNISPLRDYDIDGFRDFLPDGFLAGGSGTYTTTISPPVTLLRDGGSQWEHLFYVTVVGYGAGTVWCDNLGQEARRTIYQEKSTFGPHTVVPEGWWYNGDRAAPVYVLPHVSLEQTVYPNPVGFSGTMTVTLSLVNNMRSPPQAVNGITVTYELPNGFVYLGEAPGTPPPDEISPPYYIWRNIDLAPSGGHTIRFLLEAPFRKVDVTSRATASSAPQPDICIPKSEERVQVRRGVSLRKRPNPSEIGPYGLVEYTLEIQNLTGAPVSNVRVTDTLPYGFQYVDHVSGPDPVSLSPLVWAIPSLGAAGSGTDKTTIKFRVRSFALLGYQYNELRGTSSSVYVTYTERYYEEVRLLVVSGIGLYKTVAPSRTIAGQPVVYTITLFNGSNTDIQNIRLTDTLPSGFTFLEMVNGPAPVVTSPLVWEIPDKLRQQDSLKLSFRVATDDQLLSGTYYNQVIGSAEKAVSPFDAVVVPETGETAPLIVEGIPTVERSKSVWPENVVAGQQVTYTITLYNDTGAPQTLRLTDTLPPSVTYVAILPPSRPPVITSPVVVWDGLSIADNETVTLRFIAQVDQYARTGTYYNTLDTRTGSFVLPSLRTAPLGVTEIPRVDAQVSVDDGVLWVNEGDTLFYTVTFTNANDVGLNLEQVVLTATIQPAGYLLGGGTGWMPVSANVFTYPVGTLSPGGTGSVQFRVDVSSTVPQEIWTVTNTVQIGYHVTGTVIEADRSNNVDQDVDILRGPDLIVSDVWWEPSSPKAGQPITVYVTIENQGKDDVVARWDGSADAWWLFVVELYAKGSGFTPAGPPSDVFDHAGGYCSDAACSQTRMEYLAWPSQLQARQTRQLAFPLVLPADTYRIYIQADVSWPGGGYWGKSFGLIREAIETNNVYDGGVMVVGEPSYDVYLPVVLRNR